jgi:signal transduction histidine kinase
MARVLLADREPREEAMAGASLSIDHHRLLTRLTAAKLAVQLLERRSDFSPEQRRLVRLANEASMLFPQTFAITGRTAQR